MNHANNIVLGLSLIRTKLANPSIVVRSTLLHVPEAILDMFNSSEQSQMLSYGWEEHSAEKGYMYRLNVVEIIPT